MKYLIRTISMIGLITLGVQLTQQYRRDRDFYQQMLQGKERTFTRAELMESAQKHAQENERLLNLRTPQFTDYNLAPPATMQRLEGKWEIIQRWDGRWCKISKDRDRRRREYDRQLAEIKESLITQTEQRVWDGRVNIQSQYHIAFDPRGSGTLALTSYFPLRGIEDDTAWAIANAARRISIQNNDRGVYRIEGDRLLLYWVNLSKEGKALPTPTEIPPFPLPAGSELLVLQRIDPAELYPPAEADLPLARHESLRNEAFMRESGIDKPIIMDPDHPVPRSLERPDGFEWVVSDPKDLPEPLYRLYEERYGQP